MASLCELHFLLPEQGAGSRACAGNTGPAGSSLGWCRWRFQSLLRPPEGLFFLSSSSASSSS